MEYRATTTTQEYIARLETGADWREEIESLAHDEDITAAWFTGLGSVQDAEVWYYDQTDQDYRSVFLDEPLEIAACVGNIASLGGDPFAHTHAVLSRESGEALAGHLNAGTVFAGECYVRALDDELVRTPHEHTGLDLWL